MNWLGDDLNDNDNDNDNHYDEIEKTVRTVVMRICDMYTLFLNIVNII